MVNRGDSFRRRRSRSNSLAPTSGIQYDSTSGDVISKSRPIPNNPSGPQSDNLAAASDQRPHHHHHHQDVRTYRVAIMGAHGVGKSALVGQFMSSECINAYDRVRNGKLLLLYTYQREIRTNNWNNIITRRRIFKSTGLSYISLVDDRCLVPALNDPTTHIALYTLLFALTNKWRVPTKRGRAELVDLRDQITFFFRPVLRRVRLWTRGKFKEIQVKVWSLQDRVQ